MKVENPRFWPNDELQTALCLDCPYECYPTDPCRHSRENDNRTEKPGRKDAASLLDMEHFGGLGEVSGHVRELIGAARVVRGWVEGMMKGDVK
jgi:hypothetical protein